jgi:hypothetical protein
MCSSAGSTSSQRRVFRPQSGLTHSRARSMRASASSSSRSISSAEGTRGEWMSYTPGPISPGCSNDSVNASSTSMSERDASIESTSASSRATWSMMSLNSE